ncbi:MAG: hypothetical protein FWH04_05000 [Oscillospiraceae bacterium]|nr:hypothetical protein [Oscillospiraceae bacterium]
MLRKTKTARKLTALAIALMMVLAMLPIATAQEPVPATPVRVEATTTNHDLSYIDLTTEMIRQPQYFTGRFFPAGADEYSIDAGHAWKKWDVVNQLKTRKIVRSLIDKGGTLHLKDTYQGTWLVKYPKVEPRPAIEKGLKAVLRDGRWHLETQRDYEYTTTRDLKHPDPYGKYMKEIYEWDYTKWYDFPAEGLEASRFKTIIFVRIAPKSEDGKFVPAGKTVQITLDAVAGAALPLAVEEEDVAPEDAIIQGRAYIGGDREDIDGAFFNLTTETLTLPEGFNPTAYALYDGNRCTKVYKWPDTPEKVDKMIQKMLKSSWDFTVSDGTTNIEFGVILARGYLNPKKPVAFVDGDVLRLSSQKKAFVPHVWTQYFEYAVSSNGKTPDTGWSNVPKNGIPKPSGKTTILIRIKAMAENPEASNSYRTYASASGKIMKIKVK